MNEKKRNSGDVAKAVWALNLINHLCVCVKNKRAPMLVLEKKSKKLVSFTFEQIVGQVFEAMTGLTASDWIVPTPPKSERKRAKKGGAS